MAEVFRLPLYYSKKKKNHASFGALAIYAILLCAVVAPAVVSAHNHCNANQFPCKDGSCILQEKMCDGRQDCVDNSDEIDCDFKLCRKPHWFQCSLPHGPCLSSALVCNGIDNCPGGEDELDCVGRSRYAGRGGSRSSSAIVLGSSLDVGTGGWLSEPRNCSASEFMCLTDRTCIPLNFMCDGKGDCKDNSDELDGCVRAEANCSGFLCANRKCLETQKWMCDGVDDCGDGSDERNCTGQCNSEWAKFLCNNNTTCIDLANTCDGKPDCPDGSDEGQRCTSPNFNCTTKTCPPAAKCQMKPEIGPECVCPKGFRYSTLQNVCVDINECIERYGICSQGCFNTAGGYRCTCDDNYTLREDNRSCEAKGDDALLFYTTQVAVMGVHLRSKRVYPVAMNLSKVIGVSYDGEHIYWTNIQNEAESIVKAKGDGREQQILLTSGLDAPEDLAVDWLTGNIYFSDNVMRHIAVCSNDGLHCTVLVTVDVHQPRGVALWPQRGQIFWTDWGIKPMISRAGMDGSHSLPIVTQDIHWPNGIALDMHNSRVYWVDAKLLTIESVNPDGTERRTVLDGILKHPYGLAIFEDNLYWSDWATKSVHTCNKFTGKEHKVITKDRTIYAVYVHHEAKQPKTPHACQNTRCSHLCLLAENNSYSCACPEGMQLSTDRLHCVRAYKKQRLFIAIKSIILEMEHTTFGRHQISQTHQLAVYVNELAYNNVNGTIIVADNLQRGIYEYDTVNHNMSTLVSGNLGNISALAFDHLSHNVYWTDRERHVVEVFSLRTHQRAIVSFFSGLETPVGLAVVPEDGVMFVALRSRNQVHIDQLPLSGRGDHAHIFEDELGEKEINLTPDYDTTTLYWADSDLGRISFSDYRNMHAYTFRGRLRRPYSIAIVDDELFWSEQKSATIHWTHKSNLGPVKSLEIEVAMDAYTHVLPIRMPLLASTATMIVDHPCQHENGGCSHVCVTVGAFAGSCLCPAGLVFKNSANRTCIEALDCEFRCRSGECLTQSRRCNGRKDCPDGSDEQDCDTAKTKHAQVCSVGQFKCFDAKQCVSNEKRCDGVKDCHDGSDETHCEQFDQLKKCHRYQHACDNGNCVDFSVMCDGINDCGDNSDESNCKLDVGKNVTSRPVCDKNMFQCNSGTCIARSWECDGKIDCVDGSDEHEKCGLKDCPSNMHKCHLGQCIDARLVCDKHNDCGDFSDEQNCYYSNEKSRKIICGDEKHPMYQCPNDPTVCLDMSAKCNGTAECPRGEDEWNCGSMCSISEFQCNVSKECIRMEFRCDHDRDCVDGSDELNCERAGINGTSITASVREQPCEPNMYDCKDGMCVDLTRVCDGFTDCDTGADEGPLCKTACKPITNKPICSHRCRATPMGAVCSCSAGYRLDADRRSCLDVNECEEFDPCSQLCENTQGSYRCSCYPDFMLRTDKTSCKSIESESKLMFSTYDEVRSMSEMPIVLRVAWSTNDSKINGFDVNVRERLAYFSTDSEDVLYMVDVDSGVLQAALTVQMPTKVAVDWITGNVYVISRSQRHEIQVCSFAAKMCGRIIQANPRETLKSLALDAYNRRLLYVTIHPQSFNLPVSQIGISDLDGKRREVLYNKNGAYIAAIATDPYKRLVYFVDLHAKTLQATSYTESGSRRVITIIQKGNVGMHPSGLTVYENQAYIVNIGVKEALRCQLYGSRTCRPFNLNIPDAEDVVVDGVSRQPLASNPCGMAKCSGMCVQAEFGYECMCGSAIVTENNVCSKQLSNEVTSTALLNHLQHSSESHTATVLTLSMLLLAAIATGIGYMYYRRISQGHRDCNINLHFQNPLASLSGKLSTLRSGGSDATNAAFDIEREQIKFGTPIYRYLRNGSSQSGTEIILEPTKQSSEVHTVGQSRRKPSIVVEQDLHHNTARGHKYCDDDARARLVP